MPPGTKEYFVTVGPDDRLRVRITTDHGQVDTFTVQYETRVGSHWYPVARYDPAHGFPHRDLLDADGHVIHKQWMPLLTLKQALDAAIRDLKANWRDYRADFLRRMP